LVKTLVECNDEPKEKIFRNMSKRAAILLKEDMEASKDVAVNEVKLSQEKIVEIIRKLTDNGEIVFAGV
jgi:flagellar motor switch protein FliG